MKQARIGWPYAVVAGLGLAVTVAVSAALADPIADSVPLPRLRPSDGAPAPASATGAAIDASRQILQPDYDPDSPFTPQQQLDLANISAYFNSFTLLEGNFIQTGPNGEQSEGVFFLHRPGRIRFHYNPPSRLDIIADGSSVAIKDGRTQTQDLYPLSKTPLRYLLAANIDLTSSSLVKAVREDNDLINVTIVEKGAFADGSLTMTFDRKTYELRQWQVTDAQGLNTSVAIFNTVAGKPQTDPNLFRISIN